MKSFQNTLKNPAVGIRNSTDFSPFGVELKGRNFEVAGAGDYRFGFQGQESDSEIKGEGNSVNYKYRMHDPRLGRFFAVDPLAESYPWNSTYAFSENRVIDAIELEGLEKFLIEEFADDFGTVFKKLSCVDIYAKFEVIDENGESLQNFKYCEFQTQMKNSKPIEQPSLNGGPIGLALETPNLKQGENDKRKILFDQLEYNSKTGETRVSNFNLTINDLTEVKDHTTTKVLAGYGANGSEDYDRSAHGYGNLPWGSSRSFDALEVYLPTEAEQNQFKLNWVADKRDIEHGIKANEINFISAPRNPANKYEITCLKIETCGE